MSQNFQSILAFPFWLFNSNNWGNPELKPNEIISTHPPQFYTQASLVSAYTKIRFDPAMFALFLLFQGAATIFVWAVLLWVWFGAKKVPRTSSFPIFDAVFNTQVGRIASENNSACANNLEIIRSMKEARAHSKVE